ncbi:MAG: hypothetical protein P8046_05950 [Anaerolineales bacterium]
MTKEKVTRGKVDPEIQELVAEINAEDGPLNQNLGKYSLEKASNWKAKNFYRLTVDKRGLKYEYLNHLTMEVLLDVR